jgi:hypothetical protein
MARADTSLRFHDSSLLPMSEDLYLVHLVSGGEGKTRDMAKGPILFYKTSMFAGESAGFGLPVIKMRNKTIFPSLASSQVSGYGRTQAEYHLNLSNTWRILGFTAPRWYLNLMEKIVMGYMKSPMVQQSGLRFRNHLFRIFRIQSAMTAGRSFGYCRVDYRAAADQLQISIEGNWLNPEGELIILNEASGTDFCRLRDKPHVYDGKKFLPWQPCSMDAVIENINDRIGFSISIPDASFSCGIQFAAGREIGTDLNWAGLILSRCPSAFTYCVDFHRN